MKFNQVTGAPEGAHLAVVTSATGEALAVPVGATIFLVEDPTRPDKIIPMILTKVSTKTWRFLCGCGQRECNRVMEYRLTAKGHHPDRLVKR
jgi:hypothetical protein